ncbi:MAG: hypothetical protein ABMB14_03285 [Myxococcota bacterium]
MRWGAAWALAAGCGEGADPPGSPTVDVVSVEVTGADGGYTFAVGLRSDETGCDRYADWWEVVDADGALLFRRILDHSHPDDQPFVRDGGPVPVGARDALIVRGHLACEGCGDGFAGTAMRGSVADGFEVWTPPDGFAAALADAEPLPEGCLF